MHSPLVSVTMVTYNRAQFIEDAIHSVLAQSYSNWELIIIDDGSDDTTSSIVNRYLGDRRVRYVVNESNVGIVASRNNAMKYASGAYIAVLDSDDIWSDPQKLSKQVEWLETHKQYVLVGCAHVEIINAHTESIDQLVHPSSDQDIRNTILYKNPFTHSSILFRKTTLEKVGNYQEYTVGEDYDLILRIGTEGLVYNIPTSTIQYRKHSSNISAKKGREALRVNITIVKKYSHIYPRHIRALVRRYSRLIVGSIVLR